MAKALRPAFEIVNAQGQVATEELLGGDPVRVMPGAYTPRLKTRAGRELPLTVKAGETLAVKL